MTEEVREFLELYIHLLQTKLPEGLVLDSLLYGSIALGAYEEGKSDIDFLTILARDSTTSEAESIKRIHKELMRSRLGASMDGEYIIERDLGKGNSDLNPYLYCRNGEIRTGRWDINAVTWYTLKTKGISLIKGEVHSLSFKADWDSVISEMDYNINSYWKTKLKKPYVFLWDEWVEFAVSTLCRIMVTLESKEIVSKEEGLRRALALVNPQWKPLIEEAYRIRRGSRRKFSLNIKRAAATRKFLKEAIEVSNYKYLQLK